MMGSQNMQRYQAIVQKLNLSFSRYPGEEFFEVGEKAYNISKEDRKMILIARFLYKEADIYLIENLMDDNTIYFDFDFMTLFRDILLFKTVIFTSNNPVLIKESNFVYVFEARELVEVVPTKEFLQRLATKEEVVESPKQKPTLESIEQEEPRNRMLTVKHRINNSLITSNIDFQPELKIHRKIMNQKMQIERVLEGKTHWEKLIFGIYLTQKKRSEGKGAPSLTSKKGDRNMHAHWKELT
jgi:ABC-type multidrug transport system ATPase subunit